MKKDKKNTTEIQSLKKDHGKDKKTKKAPAQHTGKKGLGKQTVARAEDGGARMSEKTKKVLIVFTSVFLGLVLLFGLTLGVIGIVRGAASVMSYKGISVNSGVANYLAATCKYRFMSGLTASGIYNYDSPEFWQSRPEGGDKTYGEMLLSETEDYIKRVLVGSYLFDKNTKLTKDDKAKIKKSIDEVLDYQCGGDKEKFNELSEPMGFSFRDFRKASELLYKYEMSESVVFGFDGSVLENGNYGAQCADFLNTYTRVKLLFIRTENQYVTDPETGEEVLDIYDDNKKAEVKEKIDYICELISNHENDEGDEQMSETAFVQFIAEATESDSMNLIGGYYLAPTSSHTAEMNKVYPEVVRESFAMKNGEYSMVKTKFGVCFIYKCELEAGAYSKTLYSRFFSDFYSDAADYIYKKELIKYFDDVKVKKKFYNIDLVSIPYNYNLIAHFD